MRTLVVLLTVFTGFLAACADSDADRSADDQRPAASIDDSVIGAPLNDALERARAVEATLEAEAEERRRKLREAEGL